MVTFQIGSQPYSLWCINYGQRLTPIIRGARTSICVQNWRQKRTKCKCVIQAFSTTLSLMILGSTWNVLFLRPTTLGAFPCVQPIRKVHMPKQRSTASQSFCSIWSAQDRLSKNCLTTLYAEIQPSTLPNTSIGSCRWWTAGSAASRRRSKGCTHRTVTKRDGRNTLG